MFDKDMVFSLLEKARAERKNGELEDSLRDYEEALRMITPEDDELLRVLDLKDSLPAFRGVSECANMG